MWYLFIEVWVLLLIAFFVGWWAHWFLCCRNKESDTNTAAITASSEVVSSKPAAIEIKDSWKPQGFATRPDSVDDLKRIKGVGAVIEETLNELGIYQFQQVAEWTADNVNWVENFISFPGRINREGWIRQSQTLSTGGTTEFANRVDKGEIGYQAVLIARARAPMDLASCAA